MNDADRREAARRLADARRWRKPLEGLPLACRPETADEAYEIEKIVLDLLGETLAGWKVALSPQDGLLIGILLASRVFEDGARIPSDIFAMREVEAEIAYRVLRPLPPRALPYGRPEIEAALVALPAIELVDTRFASFANTSALDRTADFMANGALITGSARGAATADYSSHVASVTIDGRENLRRVGGHPSGDPFLPAMALVNHLRSSSGVAAGLVITTGSFTGMISAPERCEIEIGFEGLGVARCELI